MDEMIICAGETLMLVIIAGSDRQRVPIVMKYQS
jgi:hypothetical protein